MGIGVLMTMTAMLAGTISMSTAAGRNASYSNAKQTGYALAEAGINNAIAVLNGAYSSSTAQYPGDATLLPARTTTFGNGSVTWSGVLQQVTGKEWDYQWNLTSIATMPNPTGPTAAPVTKRITATVPVGMPPTGEVGATDVTNFIYAAQDITFTSSVSVASPVYASRDLTLQNTATIRGSARKVGVGRYLTLAQPQNQVGLVTPSTPADTRLGEIHVAGQCSSKANPTLHLCGPASSNWDTDKVYATLADSTIPPGFITVPTLPMSTMTFWYEHSSPGPKHPCNPATASGTPPTFDTGDNIINNSATPFTPVNLTPTNTSYTCQTRAGDVVIGELSWDAPKRELKVRGTIFIDGSATIDGGPGKPVQTYVGQAAIYLTGTFAMSNAKLCAVASSNDCNFTSSVADGGWNPDANALIVIAYGDGGLGGAQGNVSNIVGADHGIEMVSSSFQGGLIANKSIGGSTPSTTSNTQGPLISVYGSVTAGQSGVLTYPHVNIAPIGTSGITQPIPKGALLTPVDFSG